MKPKCPKCKKRRLGRWSTSDVMCGSCGWTKRLSDTAIIRLALEPKKPETCKWRRSKFTGAMTNDCGLAGWLGTSMPRFCSDCGKPVEVVNG